MDDTIWDNDPVLDAQRENVNTVDETDTATTVRAGFTQTQNNETSASVDPFRDRIAFHSSSPIPRVAQPYVPLHLRRPRSEETLNSIALRYGTTPGELPYAQNPPPSYLPWANPNIPYTSSSPYIENFEEETREYERWLQYQEAFRGAQIQAAPQPQPLLETRGATANPEFFQDLAQRIAQRMYAIQPQQNAAPPAQNAANEARPDDPPQDAPEGNEPPGEQPGEAQHPPNAPYPPPEGGNAQPVQQGQQANPPPRIINAPGLPRYLPPPRYPIGAALPQAHLYRPMVNPAHLYRPIPYGGAASTKLEISNPITQHVKHIEALHAVKHDTAASVATTDNIMLQLLQMLTTGRGDPAQLQQSLLQKMHRQHEIQLADTTAQQLASSHRLKNIYEHKLRLPPLYQVRTPHIGLLRAKEILSRVSPFDREKNPTQDFTDTWDEILNYTQGARFNERDYIEVLLVVLKGTARQELIRMTTACYTSLSEILEHMYLVYCNRKTLDDEIAALKAFVRMPSENIKTCMSRATQMVKHLRPHLTAAQGSYLEAERGILQSILFSVLSANTRNAIDLERRQRAKQGVTTSLIDLIQFVDDYESSHNSVPTSQTAVQQLYLPTNLAPLVSAHTLVSTPSNPVSALEPQLATLQAFMTKITKLEAHKKLKRSRSNDRSSPSSDTSKTLKANKQRSVSADPGKSLATTSSQASSQSAILPGNQLEWFSKSFNNQDTKKPRSRESVSSERIHISSQGDRKRRRLSHDEDTDMSDASQTPSYRRSSDRTASRTYSRHRSSRSAERRHHGSSRPQSRSPSPHRSSRDTAYRRHDRNDHHTSKRSSSYDDRRRSSSYDDRRRSSSYDDRRRSSSQDRSHASRHSSRSDSHNDRSSSPRRSYKGGHNSGYKKPYQKGIRTIHTPKTIITIDDRPFYTCKLQHCNVLHAVDKSKGDTQSLN